MGVMFLNPAHDKTWQFRPDRPGYRLLRSSTLFPAEFKRAPPYATRALRKKNERSRINIGLPTML